MVKNINLNKTTVDTILKMAKNDGRDFKPFVEKLLSDIAAGEVTVTPNKGYNPYLLAGEELQKTEKARKSK